MSISKISCADDLAILAREAVQQVRTTKKFRDLIAAILMANHIADWHYKKGLGARKFGESQREEMAAYYPEWNIIRGLANGAKHFETKVQATTDSIEWEDSDFWESPGHVGGDGLDWFVEVDGQRRSVTVLIENFLDRFSDQSSRP